ncbi:uncharacterized protein BDZ83DRAFT_364150 [Colletotrichum acutatum]|uniref:Uncharacterized protein n=1 Tax=Glomerella acutata TaxID=27357 RepID=A0AAD8XGI2_GLOAC|nr:uncharacterized protein BDZ83DRAFT_364150 [Colletotrichum acutatum]KAK1723973.1 hypothetical protein BDZ83DRAFT_364150 [Colletotrichum acutatum]
MSTRDNFCIIWTQETLLSKAPLSPMWFFWWFMLALFHRSQHGVDGDELRVAPRLMISRIACSEGSALAFYITVQLK